MAKENLRRVISTSTVACALKRDESKIKAMVTDLERVIYRFFIIPKEVGQLRQDMRLGGKCILYLLLGLQILCLVCMYVTFYMYV